MRKYLIIFLLLTSCFNVPVSDIPFTVKGEWTEYTIALLKEVNDYRADNNLDTLTPNQMLLDLSTKRTTYWIDGNVNKDSLHNNFFGDREPYLAYFTKIAENASYGYIYPVNAWKLSEAHNKAMLGDFNACGISVVFDKTNHKLVCLILGK